MPSIAAILHQEIPIAFPEEYFMTDGKKEKLIKLGADVLADAILKLADQEKSADRIVTRLLAEPNENIRRYKAGLAGLKRRRSFIDWRASHDYRRKLESILDDLKEGDPEPCVGVELVLEFYKADSSIIERCDDSGGFIDHIFNYYAKELFVDFASRCDDKVALVDTVLDVISEDEYGVRSVLVDCAVEYLHEMQIRRMISHFQALAERESGDRDERRWPRLVKSLSRQIKDARFYEETVRSDGDMPSGKQCVDIARVYMESGDDHTALMWLEKAKEENGFFEADRDELLMIIHGRLGNTEEQEELAWKQFRQYRTVDRLSALLAIVGEDKRVEVLDGETGIIMSDFHLSYSDVQFLIDVGRIDDAERYLLGRAGHIDGDHYVSLTPLVKTMEKHDRFLIVSVLYRALLDSILDKKRYKAYGIGVRYLKKLDTHAEKISDWGRFEEHTSFVERLRREHGRKSSFWEKYEG